jgi:hypothetical protein
MTTINEHTGDKIKTKKNSKQYRDGWNTIFNGMAEYEEDNVENQHFNTPCSDYNCVYALNDDSYIKKHAENCEVCNEIYKKIVKKRKKNAK